MARWCRPTRGPGAFRPPDALGAGCAPRRSARSLCQCRVMIDDAMIGLVHPGEMGAAVGACLRAAGRPVAWSGTGRSAATHERAGAAGLSDVGGLGALVPRCGVIVSVCPPYAARQQADAVLAAGFRGCYVDANAIAPATARHIGEAVVAAGGTFVDGGIVGPPPTRPGVARLYLSGHDAAPVAELFTGSLLDTVLVGGGPGAASALKMTYAAWSKGTLALLLAIIETARHEGVEDVLRAEWARSQPDVDGRPGWHASRPTRRAGGGWRRCARSLPRSPRPTNRWASTWPPPRCSKRRPRPGAPPINPISPGGPERCQRRACGSCRPSRRRSSRRGRAGRTGRRARAAGRTWPTPSDPTPCRGGTPWRSG